jgi:molecular chaperone DnaK
MKRDAEAHSQEDRKRRELIDIKNRTDAMVHQTRRSLEEHGAKVSPETRGRIESALSNLEDKLKGDDKAAIEAAAKELENASMELGKAVYEETARKSGGAGAGAPSGDGARGAQTKAGDDVIDAEFEVKDNG